jgi:hypothetical protein
MSLWTKGSQGVKAVADAVESIVNKVGDVIGNAVEAVGDGINDALVWVGDRIGVKPLFAWPGGLFKGGFALVGAGIKALFGFVAGIVGGMIKIAGGLLTWRLSLLQEGALDIVSTVFGMVVVVAGKLVSLFQSLVYLQDFERPLTAREKTQLQTVFRDNLNYYVIRIVEGHSGLFGVNNRPFTLGNTIYMKRRTFPTDLLVHETTHVWQYQQTGIRYASDALLAQWFVDDAYNWRKEINARHKADWTRFNNEAQAQFFQDLWKYGELRDGSGATLQTGRGLAFTADGSTQFGYFEMGRNDYTSIAREAVTTVRKKWF